MKVTIIEAGKTELPFPKYMWSYNQQMIVFMGNPYKGTVIHSENPHYNVGYYSDSWCIKGWTDFKGEIKIEQ